jgi:hypothetical protein
MTGSGAAAALMSTHAIHKAAYIVFRLVASGGLAEGGKISPIVLG